MIYITGDTHNSEDMTTVSSRNMKLCCAEQKIDYQKITNLIILGDFGLPWFHCPVDENGIHPPIRQIHIFSTGITKSRLKFWQLWAIMITMK